MFSGERFDRAHFPRSDVQSGDGIAGYVDQSTTHTKSMGLLGLLLLTLATPRPWPAGVYL